MPKTFLDFTNTGYLSSANFIGYQDNQEFSINFKTLAAAVSNYIEDKKAEMPMIYRFQPTSSVVISDTSKTYGMYLSSSVQELDIKLNGEWITLTKAGSGYDVSTNSLILSTDRHTVYPQQAVNVINTALSTSQTIYFYQTGSSIFNIIKDKIKEEFFDYDVPTGEELLAAGIEAQILKVRAERRQFRAQQKANELLEMMKELSQQIRAKMDDRFPPLASGYYDEDATQEEKDSCERYRATLERVFLMGVEKNIESAETADPAEVLRLADVLMRNSKGIQNQLNKNLGGEDPCGVPQPESDVSIDFSDFENKLKSLGNTIDEINRINEQLEEL